MSTFQIHQDSEKENPLQQKQPKAGKNVLQPSALGGVRQTITQRNTNAPRIVNEKGAFREIKPKVKDENAGFAATNSTNAAAAKKSVAVPVVEFKTFSVYEDNCEDAKKQQHQQHQQQQHVAATIVEQDENIACQMDKENAYVAQQRKATTTLQSVSIHKEFAVNDDDYNLDTTPMSVSDVLSPMSVDRSNILQPSRPHLIDVSSNFKVEAEDDEEVSVVAENELGSSLPRNDRDRFFDVVEYQRDILSYFRESEQKHRPKPNYMARQSDINYSMRTILVDWLVEVSEEYNLDTETLYLSVSYIDRFLSQMSVVRSKLQLVGTAAMYIASKYEEIYPPEVNEFVFITDDTYTKLQVLRMEQIILKILTFDLCTPTAHVYINTYSVFANMTDQLKCLTQYISELSLLEAEPYLRFLPSLISSAALALARYVLNYPTIWSVELEEMTSYRLEDLREVILHLNNSHNAATTSPQKAIQEKYKSDTYKQVSAIAPVDLTADQFDDILKEYNKLAADAEVDSKNNKVEPTTAGNENVRRMISLMFNDVL